MNNGSTGPFDKDANSRVSRNNVPGGGSRASDAIGGRTIDLDAVIVRPRDCPGGIGADKAPFNNAGHLADEDTSAATLLRCTIDYQTPNGAAKGLNIKYVKNGT